MGEGLSLEEVARRLERAGVTWAVFAGAAAAVYGSDRPLTDVDILVSAGEGTRVACLFPEAVVKRQEDGRVRGIELPTGSINLPAVDIIAGLTMVEGDVTYHIDLDEEMAARRTRHEIAGIEMPVIPVEDNILLKAVWGRGPEEGKHDWEDVHAMLAHVAVSHGAVDWAYLHWRAEGCCSVSGGLLPGVQRALERLQALAKEGKG
jgi:hypothetical protein